MYTTLLLLHSWSRWLVLGFGLIAVYRGYVGWTGHQPFVRADNSLGASFSGFMWLQVIIGLGLYFGLSPWGLNAMKQAGAMKDPTKRFFGLEHVPRLVPQAIDGSHAPYDFYKVIHKACWKIGAGVLGLHVLGALWHHVVMKDNVLRRMWKGA